MHAIGGYGGAISRFYTQDDEFDWMGVLRIENSTIEDNINNHLATNDIEL